MTQPRLTLIVNNEMTCSQSGRDFDQKSWSNKFDPHALKVSGPELWSAYFRARFASPREVALFCDVSFQTALNWWGAVTAPAGHVAILVMLSDPGAPAFFVGEMRRAA